MTKYYKFKNQFYMKRTRVVKLGINFRLVSFSRISYNRTNEFMDSQIILLLAKILHEWKKLDSKGYIRVFNFVSFITYSFDYILSYNKKQDSIDVTCYAEIQYKYIDL